MIRTLYLDGRREPLDVVLYGAALRIDRPESASVFAPLGRTRRICCRGRVHWAGEALIACAVNAIPVSFLSHGRGVGYFLPTRPPARAFGALLEEAVLHPAWDDRFENFIDSEAVRSLHIVADGSSPQWAGVRLLLERGDARQALRAGLRLGGDRPRRIWRHLHEYLHAWIGARLLGEDFSLACFGYSSDKPNLPEHFSRALAPLLLPTLLQQSGREAKRRRPDGPLDRSGEGSLAHRCALAFDHAEPRLVARTPHLLRRFERLVRDCAEEVDPWPGS